MKPRGSLFVAIAIFLIVFLPGAIGPLSPSTTLAQDRILPLKVKAGDKAPDFALADAEGKVVKLSDFKGHAVLLDFYRGFW